MTANERAGERGRRGSFLARHWQRLLAAAIWLALAGGFLAYSVAARRTPAETLADLVGLLRTPAGPLLYILIYTLRPLTFFSATVVTLTGGAIWGPLWGVLYVVIGSNLSATVAYTFGRFLGQGMLPEGREAEGFVARYAERLRRNTFGTVMLMHLIFLPYDLVNYLAGFLRAPYRPFLLGSILGSVPGTLTFVLAGSSLDIERILAGQFSVAAINPWTLLLSAVLFVGAITVSRVLRRREGVV